MIWATHVLQWCPTKGSNPARASKSQKRHPSSDCRLQPACTKLESLVIADQHAAVNTFPGLVHTARHTMGVRLYTPPVTPWESATPEVSGLTAKKELPKVGLITGVKS